MRTDAQPIGHTIEWFETLPSTNEYAKGQPGVHGMVYAARQQTAGKGRLGKTWYSKRDEGLFLSVVLVPQLPAQALPQLTLAAGLGVCHALREVCGVDAAIKWPNDVVVQGKKLCGILTELVMEGEQTTVIVGVGINVNNGAFPQELESVATSLRLQTGVIWEQQLILQEVLRRLEQTYRLLCQQPEAVARGVADCCVNIGKQVTVTGSGLPTQGTAVGISPKGELLVRRQDGTVQAICSGEVSVRGVYGYV